MRYTIAAILAAFMLGCNTSDPQSTELMAVNAGRLAAYVVSTSPKFTPEVRNGTIEVLKVLNAAAPAQDQTLTQAWSPLIKQTTDKLVADGKLKPADAALVQLAGVAFTESLDAYLAKHPEYKADLDKFSIVCRGFTYGALTQLDPECCTPASVDAEVMAQTKAVVKAKAAGLF